MKTKQMLSTATAENAQVVIDEASRSKDEGGRGWTPAQILRHGNPAIVARLGKATSATVAVAPKAKTPKQPKPKLVADTSKATSINFAADFTPYAGGETVQEFVSGQRGIVGPRGGQYALLVTDSDRKFRLSQASLTRLLDGERVLSWVQDISTYISLA